MKLILPIAGALLVVAVASAETGRKPSLFPTDAEGNEVLKSIPVKEQESRVLHGLNTMPKEKLQELLQVYEKMDNKGMMDAIVRAILKRDPKDAEALRVRDEIDPKEVVRDAGYLKTLEKKVLAGETVEDTDGVGVHASNLLEDEHAAEAVKLLEALRNNQFKDKPFPFLDDLAFGYAETGRLDKAEAAYKAVLADQGFSAESRDEAERALAGLAIKKRIAAIRQRAGGNPEELAQGSAKLYAEMPDEGDVIDFRIDALQQAHHYDEALSLLESLRAKWHGQGTWAHLPDLAQTYYGLKRYDEAIATFRQVQKAADFDTATKGEAENMILEIQVGRLIEQGTSALDKGRFAEAKDILDQLERDYRTHDDVLGFKAMYLAKTGRSSEALDLLYARKREADQQHLPFSQQDVIADVYVERKEFALARQATLQIVNDPRYDEEFRREAAAKLIDIRVDDLLDQGYRNIEDGNRSAALRLERELETFAADRLEVRVFEAEVALACNQNVYARNHLWELKHEYPQKPFPGQNSLASAFAETGMEEQAYNAYAEVNALPGYDLNDRWEAGHDGRELIPFFRPTLRVETHYEHSSEGSIFSSEARFSTLWYDDWRYTVFGRSDFTRLSRNSIFGGRGDTRYEGGVTATRKFGNGYFAEATVGGSDNDVIYGARIGKQAHQSLGWSLGFAGNTRATDSTTIQALNGRENRVDFKVAGPIAERLMLDLETYYQWVKVGDSRIGNGYGFEASLDYVVQTEKRNRPEILIGYHGEYRQFNGAGSLPRAIRDQIRRADIPGSDVRPALGPNEEVRRAVAGNYGREVFDELVDPNTNRQGVEIKVRKHLTEQWSLFAQAGAYYAFDDHASGWDASLGVEYWIGNNAMLFGELRYDSDGKGAAAGSGVWEANLGGSVSF